MLGRDITLKVNSKNIVVWRDVTHPWAGGAEVYIHEIGKLVKKGHDVTLFCGEYLRCEKESIINGIRPKAVDILMKAYFSMVRKY